VTPGYTQKNRTMGIETPLGADVLLLHTLVGTEAVSEPFKFELGMYSSQASIPFQDIVGQNATIRFLLPDEKLRYINGFVRRFTQGVRLADDLTYYSAELVPWLWFLKYKANCRIFQRKSVPDIIKAVFADGGFSDHAFRLYGAYEEREYCVQYRETDFQFISRLMEEEGIFYFFEHENGKHTLVLSDSSFAFKPCPNQEHAPYESNRDFYAGVHEWTAEERICTGQYTQTDYNFEYPSTNLRVNVEGSDPHEIYDYPGRYGKITDGERLTRIRLQEVQSPKHIGHGVSTCMPFTAGSRFTMSGHFRSDQNTSYVLMRVKHESIENFYRNSGAEAQYTNTFECLPDGATFRPSRVTPKPLIHGAQTAQVVGKPGEEIWTDKYGRVKVQFHWDREGKKNEDSSCWIRVAQEWAGKRWGSIFLPRIGQEVIVSFLEGDPDRPIITGRVYNAEQMPPDELPAEQTRSIIRTQTFKGGGFNELRFDDATGKEQIFLHAQRNFDLRVKHNRFETMLGQSHLITEGNHYDRVGGDSNSTVQGDSNLNVSGSISVNGAVDFDTKVGIKYALEAGQEVHLKSGMNLVIESGVSLTLKVGGNFINLNPAGIFINGTMVMINSGGVAGTGSGASPDPAKKPLEADKSQGGLVSKVKPDPAPKKPPAPLKPVFFGPAATALLNGANSGALACKVCAKK
jgi:type VI secretion system secreted protein VgrG